MKKSASNWKWLTAIVAVLAFTTSQADDLLNDTNWQLVEFQSMDDAQGIKKPHDPAVYTMMLNADGSTSMKLNCNRARGTWKSSQSNDSNSGSFEFGPLAMTRALCPPPSMDEFIAMQSSYIRSYVIKNEKLYLSLMADGGIFVWQQSVKNSD